jgi:hypothetical protein
MEKQYTKLGKKIMMKVGIFVKKAPVLAIVLTILFCLGFFWIKQSSRPVIYLIPEGTKGWCHLVWDDPNASPLIGTANEQIVYFNNKGIAHTSSSPDEASGVQYYYVDKHGKRTEIIVFTLQLLEKENKDYPETTIFLYGGGLQRIDEGPDGPFYPSVDQFFLGTYDEVKKEDVKLDKEGAFPPYPEDALRLKRNKK